MYTCTHVESVFAKDETNTDSKSIIIENCEILSKYFVVFRFVLFATFFRDIISFAIVRSLALTHWTRTIKLKVNAKSFFFIVCFHWWLVPSNGFWGQCECLQCFYFLQFVRDQKRSSVKERKRERAMGSYRGAPFVDRKFVRFYVMINRLTYIVMCVYDINQRLCRSIILYPVSV